MSGTQVENIWIFSHYAQQPPYNTMLRYHNWGKELIKRGGKVTIFCASTVHNTEINIDSVFAECDGINYRYIKTCKYQGNGLKRILNMLLFYVRVFSSTKELSAPDAIIAGVPHPFTALAGIKIARKMKVPLICDTADLWPQAFVDLLNYNPKNPVILGLYLLEEYIYKRSDALIFSFEGGRDYLIDRGINKLIDMSKVFHINMGLDLQAFDNNCINYTFEDNELLDENTFKVVYCGSIRMANNVKIICDGAKILLDRGYDNIRFLIHGNGDMQEELEKYCNINNVTNVIFYGRIKKENIPYLLSHADINILTFIQSPLAKYGSSQSKLFEYLASGKPIISNVSFGYNLLDRYNCGYVMSKQSPDAFADNVLHFYNMNIEEYTKMGGNGRRAAYDYDQPVLVNQLMSILENTLIKFKGEYDATV